MEVGGDGGVWVSSLKHVVVVFVKMHKTIMGATHFFFGGVSVVATGWGSWKMLYPCMSKYVAVCESTD